MQNQTSNACLMSHYGSCCLELQVFDLSIQLLLCFSWLGSDIQSALYQACHLLRENSILVTFISLPPLIKSCGLSLHSLCDDVECSPEHFLQCHQYLRTYYPTVNRKYIILESEDRAEDTNHIDFCCVYLSLYISENP